MNIPTQRLITIGNWLLAELRLLRSEFHQLMSTIGNQQEADRQQQKANELNTNLPERIIRAERQIQEYTQRDQRTYNNLQLWAQLALVIGTWGAFIAAAIYAGFAAYQTHEMARAADAAATSAKTAACALQEGQRQFSETLTQMQGQTRAQQSAADAARKALTTSERPWLAVEASIKDRGADTIDYGAAIKNFGSVPATRVGFDLTVKAAKQITGESIPEACRSAKERSAKGIYVIPGYSFTYNPHAYIVGIGAAPEPPFLVGCVSYFGQFDDPHHTEVCVRPDFRDPQHVTFQPCPNMPLKAD